VRAERFGKAPVPLLRPSASESFEEVAAPLRQHAFSLQEEDRSLAAIRDTLLPQLMSGKLRVKDAEKQVEAVA
jgi:type I restriction enzyme S subunit